MVVKPSPTQVFLLEWGGGLFVCPLDGAAHGVLPRRRPADHASPAAASRSGVHRTRVEDNIEEFVDMLLRSGLGSNAAVPFGKRSFRQPRSRMRSEATTDEPVIDDLAELFCSKTVAVCYKSAGLIAPSRDAGMFLPKHFSHDYDKIHRPAARREPRPRDRHLLRAQEAIRKFTDDAARAHQPGAAQEEARGRAATARRAPLPGPRRAPEAQRYCWRGARSSLRPDPEDNTEGEVFDAAQGVSVRQAEPSAAADDQLLRRRGVDVRCRWILASAASRRCVHLYKHRDKHTVIDAPMPAR